MVVLSRSSEITATNSSYMMNCPLRWAGGKSLSDPGLIIKVGWLEAYALEAPTPSFNKLYKDGASLSIAAVGYHQHWHQMILPVGNSRLVRVLTSYLSTPCSVPTHRHFELGEKASPVRLASAAACPIRIVSRPSKVRASTT